MKRFLTFFACLALPISAKVTPGMALETIEKLQVQSGVSLHVQCAPKPHIEVISINPLVSKMTIDMKDQTLVLDAKGKGELGANFVRINLFVAQPISSIDARLGVDAKVDACAVSHEALAVVLDSNSILHVSGNTKVLKADLANGGFFNYQSESKLSVSSADITCMKGCKANLSGAQSVQGSVALGSEITVGSQAKTKKLQQGTGGHIRR
jgi:hypothetical protein